MEIKTEMLSAKHLEFRRNYYGAAIPYSQMLVRSLLLKKYVFHSKNLKFYLERGMKMTKVCRGIKFSTGDSFKVVAYLPFV